MLKLCSSVAGLGWGPGTENAAESSFLCVW